MFWMIVVMSAVSLLLSEWGWRKQPHANFYLAPTRAWELFAGSIAAFVVQKQGVQKNNMLACAGFVAIVFSIISYDETTPFPSVYALVPVLGAVLIVLYADKDTFAAKLLSTKGFVGIGLISYSAYLYHQPLFAFARIRSIEDATTWLMLGLTLASLAIGYFSWRYIEQPFRSKQTFSNLQIFKASILGLIVFVSFGYVGVVNNGFPLRFSADIVSIQNGVNDFNPNRWTCQSSPTQFRPPNESCILGRNNVAPSFALIGDSHSDSLAHVLSLEAEKQGLAFRHMWHNSCPPILGVRREREKHLCLEYNDLASEFITKNAAISTVVLSAWWSEYLSDTGAFVYDPNHSDQTTTFDRSQHVISQFVSTVKYYSERKRKVIITGQVPEMDINIPLQFPRVLTNSPEYFDYTIERSKVETRTALWQEAIKSVEALNHENIIIIDPVDFLCDATFCYGTLEGKSLYRDSHHLSNIGASYLVNKVIKQIIQKPQ